MPDETRLRESFTKSFHPKQTVRSFTGDKTRPTPLPAETPFAVTPVERPAPSTTQSSQGGSDSKPSSSGPAASDGQLNR
jgi:hypothetical protein